MTLRDRRRRVRRPGLLVLFGIGYLLMPVVNYIGAVIALDVPLHFYQVVLRSFDPMQYGIMGLGVVAGVGLLRIKKWGWWFALALAGVITIHNLVILIQTRSLYNLSALLLTAFAIGILLYFTRKDISAPYMRMYPRGWRYQKRTPIELDVKIAGEAHKTTDISQYGLYAKLAPNSFEPGQELRIEIEMSPEVRFDLTGVIVRVDENGAGFAFRNMDAEEAARLQNAIRAAA